MGLIANGVRLSSANPMRQYGAASAGTITRMSFGVGPAQRLQWAGQASIPRKAGLPAGYRHPYTWLLPSQSGGLAARRRRIIGSGGASSANLAGGRNGAAALSGSGTISSANLALVVSAVAALSGSGALTGSILGKLLASAGLSGSGALVAAIKAKGWPSATVAGVGALVSALAAKGSMAAEIVVTGDALTTANVADAVWDAALSQHLQAGSTGAALNAAGGAGDPWITSLPGAYTAGSAGYILGHLLESIPAEVLDDAATVDGRTLREVFRLVAAVLGGKTSGGATTDVVRSVDDTKDRVTTTIDSNGHRTAVTLDLS